MKLIFCLLLTQFIAVDLHSQNCKALENKMFFRSLKLGDQVPRNFTDCMKNAEIKYPDYTDYRLDYDSLNRGCRKKYSDLFTFYSIPFSNSLITANKKRQVFQIKLYYFFEDSHSKDSIFSTVPANFNKLFNKLVSLYGRPTQTEESPDRDLLFIKELGMQKLVIWECNNINLQLRVKYGCRTKALNIIDVQIKDSQFDLIEQIELL